MAEVEHSPVLSVPCQEATARLEQQIAKAGEIISSAKQMRIPGFLAREVPLWHTKTVFMLRDSFSTEETVQEYESVASYAAAGSDDEVEAGLLLARQDYLRALSSVAEYCEPKTETDRVNGTGEAEPAGTAASKGNSVFIIHGHDLTAARKLQNLIRDRFKTLTPVLLNKRPTKGRFIGEKFEAEAGSCGFAFAILSPDDLVEVKDTGETYNQMRPNVIYELGWFHGRLGRSRSCMICREGTKLPSDLAGIGVCRYTRSVEEASEDIEIELKAAYGDDLS